MSATNRGSRRRKYDLYETPEEVTRDFLFNHFVGEYKRILEPCAGSGKMVKVLRERYPTAKITAVEKYPEGKFFFPLGTDHGVKGDFLDIHSTESFHEDYDLVFTNPPYTLAEKIITHAMEQWPKATIVMLLRLNFLGSQQRHDWWQDKLPNEIHVLSKRPSFIGKGTDATEYAWFVWRPGVKGQKINVIWGEETGERQKRLSKSN